MKRTYDEILQEVAAYVPQYLLDELNEAIDQEIADCMPEGSDEVLNYTVDSDS